jgi:hypothetical protein
MTAASEAGERFVGRLSYFYQLSALWYLADGRALAARALVAPAELKVGVLYFAGSHKLPLEGLAAAYGERVDAFRERGHCLGGSAADYGDAAVRLRPFPHVPVVILLWTGDDEFPARAGLLLHPECEAILPPDVIWSIAMMSVLAML